MVAIYDEKLRSQIRQALHDYLKGTEVSVKRLAAAIRSDRYKPSVSASTIGRFLDPSPKSQMVGHDCVATLELYLRDKGALATVPPQAEGPAPATPVPFFRAAAGFFRMIPAKEQQYSGPILGDYTFYAHSETIPGRISRGAISFSIVDHEFCISERQESTPAGGTTPYHELYSGHFLFRKDAVIAMLGEHDRTIPKFYILSITSPTNEEGRKRDVRRHDEMRGILEHIHQLCPPCPQRSCAQAVRCNPPGRGAPRYSRIP